MFRSYGDVKKLIANQLILPNGGVSTDRFFLPRGLLWFLDNIISCIKLPFPCLVWPLHEVLLTIKERMAGGISKLHHMPYLED